MIYLHFSKVFDTVIQKSLIGKLIKYSLEAITIRQGCPTGSLQATCCSQSVSKQTLASHLATTLPPVPIPPPHYTHTPKWLLSPWLRAGWSAQVGCMQRRELGCPHCKRVVCVARRGLGAAYTAGRGLAMICRQQGRALGSLQSQIRESRGVPTCPHGMWFPQLVVLDLWPLSAQKLDNPDIRYVHHWIE